MEQCPTPSNGINFTLFDKASAPNLAKTSRYGIDLSSMLCTKVMGLSTPPVSGDHQREALGGVEGHEAWCNGTPALTCHDYLQNFETLKTQPVIETMHKASKL
eukprot:203906-Amphidinium_carterae.2